MKKEPDADCIRIEEHPDTFIEKIFLEKTIEDNIYFMGPTLRRNWFADKHEYIKKTSTIVLDYQHYSKHDQSHSISILNSVELLLGKERIKLLGVGDLLLLLEVAYSHDIGMTTNDDELRDLWTQESNDANEFKKLFQEMLESNVPDTRECAEYLKEINDLLLNKKKAKGTDSDVVFEDDWPIHLRKVITIVMSEYIRKKHGQRSQKILYGYAKDKEEEEEITARLYRVAGDIATIHTQTFNDIFKKLEKEEYVFESAYIHPRFIATLLRIGDLLDMDNDRFDPYILQHFGKLPPVSELHLKKHRALTHFNITPYQINATVESNDIRVCTLASDWFKWLKKETNNLIKSWNMIVPDGLGGCNLSSCKLRIYYNGTRFRLNSSNTYEIDKKYAHRLLIGNNIYGSKLDFLREYIQNALDASKLGFYEEMKAGDMDYFICNANKPNADICMPFMFKEEAFKKFTIKINMRMKYNKNAEEVLELCIKDRGVGIAKEELQSLTTIGSGWSCRKRYFNIFEEILPWLKTTGGFGIGIQTAFMVSDEVEYVTKSKTENEGYHIS